MKPCVAPVRDLAGVRLVLARFLLAVRNIMVKNFAEGDFGRVWLACQFVQAKFTDLQPTLVVTHGVRPESLRAFVAVRVVPAVHQLLLLPSKPPLSHWIAPSGCGDCRLGLYVAGTHRPMSGFHWKWKACECPRLWRSLLH